MKKLLKGLLLATFAVSTVNAATNKTFLMPRSQGVNLAMEYATYNELIQHKNGDFFGANFQVVPFYMESGEKADLGKYFGIANKNLIKLGKEDDVTARTADFNLQFMIHDYNLGGGNAAGSVKFEPQLQAYGARIDYYQDLEKILDGLYLKIAVPIVHVENDMHITTDVSTPHANFTAANLDSYFKGTTTLGTIQSADGQLPLQYAKIYGSKSETSVADIDFILGYKLFEKDDYYVALNLGLTIPVGNDPDARWVFEPIVGNGGHWGFGGGLDASVKLWEDGDQNIKLTAAANYRYLFENTQRRTLGLLSPAGDLVNWGQYYLAGEVGVACNGQLLFPVANILTQNVNVETGSQFDAAAYLTYNNGGWSFDLGYNFYYKDSEDVTLKDSWNDTKYIIVKKDQNMSVAGQLANMSQDAAAQDNGGSLGYIATTPDNSEMQDNEVSQTAYGIATSVAETPSQDTHKIFGSLGYIFRDWEYPVMLGIGGGYEFANSGAIENWQLWGKLGIKF